MGRHSMPSPPRGSYAAAVGERREARAGARKTNFDGGREREHTAEALHTAESEGTKAKQGSAGWHRLVGGGAVRVGHDAPGARLLRLMH